MREGPKYYGIYRGTVVNNIDPMQLGRIMVTVTDVGGLTPSTWATPCVPLAGKQMGTFMVPQIGAGVWVQFEAGDPDRPVWTGGWWGITAELPALALLGPPPDPPIVIQTTLQNAHRDQRSAGTYRRDHAEEYDGRDDHRERYGHLYPER